jgi:prolyl oligopeptidase
LEEDPVKHGTAPDLRAAACSFFYWRQQKPAPGAPPQARYLNAKAYLHVLGRNPDEDPAVLGRGLNPAVNISEADFATVHPGAKYALAIIRHGAKPETDPRKPRRVGGPLL